MKKIYILCAVFITITAIALTNTPSNAGVYNPSQAGTIGQPVLSGTAGSVLFIDGSGNLGENNANFFWDNTNTRLGIGTTTPAHLLDVNGNFRVGVKGIDDNLFLVDTGTGFVGIGTSTPTSVLSIDPGETTATSTLHIGNLKSVTNGSCIQMYAPDGTKMRLFITNKDNTLVTEPGNCN